MADHLKEFNTVSPTWPWETGAQDYWRRRKKGKPSRQIASQAQANAEIPSQRVRDPTMKRPPSVLPSKQRGGKKVTALLETRKELTATMLRTAQSVRNWEMAEKELDERALRISDEDVLVKTIVKAVSSAQSHREEETRILRDIAEWLSRVSTVPNELFD